MYFRSGDKFGYKLDHPADSKSHGGFKIPYYLKNNYSGFSTFSKLFNYVKFLVFLFIMNTRYPLFKVDFSSLGKLLTKIVTIVCYGENDF